MKKTILAITLCCMFIAGTCFAQTRITVTKDSAGTMSGVTRLVTQGGPVAGQTVFTIDPTTGVSFYMNYAYIGNLVGGTGSGVSQLAAGTPGYFVVYDTSVSGKAVQYASGASIDPDTTIVSGVSTLKVATAGVSIIMSSTTDFTLSGESVYGTYICNYGAPSSGTTITFPSAKKGMSTSVLLSQNTLTSGGTMYIHWPVGQTLICNQTITAGTSKFIVGGTVASKTITAIGIDSNIWQVQTTGTPSVDWD